MAVPNTQHMQSLLYLVPALAVLGLIVMAIQAAWVRKQDTGSARMSEIAQHIHEGALAFLSAEYRILAIFVVVAGALLGLVSAMVETTHWFIVVAFVIGAVFSALAGNIGMRIATQANVRTTQAARTSLSEGLKVSFTGGMVMGLGVAGLAVFGLSVLFILLLGWMGGDAAGAGTSVGQMTVILEALAGFSLGAESIALFARVGGGIYTKAADVGADLVGKVEAGIPEDDPRNPATIADNVGDNVGDVAGMGADLFGSYVATVLAAMVLGNYVINDMGGSIADDFGGMSTILLPLVISALGIVFSILGAQVIRVGDDAKEAQVQAALNRGNWGSIVLTAIACYFLIDVMLPSQLSMDFFGEGTRTFSSMNVFYAVLVGLIVGGAISWMTKYYTGLGKKPVMDIVQKSSTGAATNIIAGLATGMISTFGPVLLFAAAIYTAYEFAGFYGVAIAACSMMATTAMQLAIDAFGPIADIPGIMEGTGTPDYGKCVDISTQAALKEMMLPGAMTIAFPLVIGLLPLLLGKEAAWAAETLGGYMAGVTVSGVLWAIFQNNAGGAWDNAKKSFEAGVEIDGEMTFKGSEAHKAAVTGDTVGDPFKDTSGPSMNILIKLTCLVGLVIAPILGGEHESGHAEDVNISATEVVEMAEQIR